MKDIIEHISSISLFNGLSKEECKNLSKIVENRVYKRGELIFSEGDDGTGFYVVISGRVKIFKLKRDLIIREKRN